jgi:hypothetical protein
VFAHIPSRLVGEEIVGVDPRFRRITGPVAPDMGHDVRETATRSSLRHRKSGK